MVPFPFSCRRTCATFMSPAVVTASLVLVPCVIILHRLHLPVRGSPWRRVRGHQTHNALVLPPASTVAARPLCVCVKVFLSRSSRRDSFRQCSLSTHLDSSRRRWPLLVDTHYRLNSTSRRGLLPVGHFFVDSSRLVSHHVLFHLT